MAPPTPVVFTGCARGRYRVLSMKAVCGEPLLKVPAIERFDSGVAPSSLPNETCWVLKGSTGHQRYVERAEASALSAVQPPLGRTQATCAALIPIRKSDAWWDLPQDERRAILEPRSRHITIGMHYLPAVARRLYHSRELGESFDFLTWFEYAPADAPLFEALLGELRATEEWKYVVREVDIRLSWTPPN